jgi:hypothetical protein
VNRFRPILASVLLAAWLAGGVMLPVLHDAAHVAERAKVEQTHRDHHHHQIEDDHRAEIQPYCPDATNAELVCALCQVHVAAMLASSSLAFTAPSLLDGSALEARPEGIERTATSARGPPTA